jgi:hypothetical protein
VDQELATIIRYKVKWSRLFRLAGDRGQNFERLCVKFSEPWFTSSLVSRIESTKFFCIRPRQTLSEWKFIYLAKTLARHHNIRSGIAMKLCSENGWIKWFAAQ